MFGDGRFQKDKGESCAERGEAGGTKRDDAHDDAGSKIRPHIDLDITLTVLEPGQVTRFARFRLNANITLSGRDLDVVNNPGQEAKIRAGGNRFHRGVKCILQAGGAGSGLDIRGAVRTTRLDPSDVGVRFLCCTRLQESRALGWRGWWGRWGASAPGSDPGSCGRGGFFFFLPFFFFFSSETRSRARWRSLRSRSWRFRWACFGRASISEPASRWAKVPPRDPSVSGGGPLH